MQAIVGQTRAIELLQRQLQSGRLHHAYVFSGPVGVGKFTAALAFGRILLCHDRQATLTGEVEACGNCASCRLLAPRAAAEADDADAVLDDEPAALAAAHPDLHVVRKELARYSDDKLVRDRKLTQIPVDVLRTALIEPVYRAAQLNHGKLFIVDEAELLNLEGQNLLLKTLEEPPAGTTLILVTSSEDRLLPTIRSRCQRIAFVPLDDAVVRQWIDAHQPGLIERDRQWLTVFASGSLGRASLGARYGLIEWAETVLSAVDRLAVGRSAGELGAQIHERIDGFAKAWVEKHDNASKEAANKLAAALMGSMIAGHAQRRIAELAPSCDPHDPAASEAALEPWLGVIDAVNEMSALLRSNVNLSLACDHLVSAMSRRLGAV